MSLGMYTIKKKDLPKYVSLSEDQRSRCEELLVIKYVGVDYYIPVTKEVTKVIKLFDSKRFNTRTEDFFRDIINAVLIQIRDSIGADIHRQLNQQIAEGFEKMFDVPLQKQIREKLDQKMLPEKKEKKES